MAARMSVKVVRRSNKRKEKPHSTQNWGCQPILEKRNCPVFRKHRMCPGWRLPGKCPVFIFQSWQPYTQNALPAHPAIITAARNMLEKIYVISHTQVNVCWRSSWRKREWRSSGRRRRRMWRGRAGRKRGYRPTAVRQIIIGFIRQHLLCQHSSRQPRGGRAEKCRWEWRGWADRNVNKNTTQRDRKRRTPTRTENSQPEVTGSNTCLPCCRVLDHERLPSGWPWPLTFLECLWLFSPWSWAINQMFI